MTPKRSVHAVFDSELCLIGAPTDAELHGAVVQALTFLDHAPVVALPDMAFTTAQMARQLPAVLAVVATSVADLRDKLRIAERKLREGVSRIRDKSGLYYTRERLEQQGGRIAFVFPGELSPYPQMLCDICIAFPCCRAAFDETDDVCAGFPDMLPMSEWVFPASPASRGAPGNPLFTLTGAMLAAHTANTALARLLNRFDIRPDAVVGHSIGEFAALEAAGCYGALARTRRIAMLRDGISLLSQLDNHPRIPEAVILAVEGACSRERIADWVARYPGRITPAMQNGPSFTLLAIAPDSVSEIRAELDRDRIRHTVMQSRLPGHTPWFAHGLPPIEQHLSTWITQPPTLPLYSCASAAVMPSRASGVVAACLGQWTQTVLFDQTIEAMYADGIRIFIEVGARGLLAPQIGEQLGDRPHLALAANRIHRSDVLQLHHVLAQLAAHGVGCNAAELHRTRNSRLLALDRPDAVPPRTEAAVRLASALPEIRPFDLPFTVAGRPDVRTHTFSLPAMLRRGDFGAECPLLVAAEVVAEKRGVSIELLKTLSPDDYPFIRDCSLGTDRSAPSGTPLHGLTVLSITTGLELMAEAARRLVPRKRLAQALNIRAQRWVGFVRNAKQLNIKAEVVEWNDKRTIAVQARLFDPDESLQFATHFAEATFLFTNSSARDERILPPPLQDPKPADWTGSDIYPDRLIQGPLLQSVRRVTQRGADGLDYELAVLPRAGLVRHTPIPLFTCWPQILDGIGSGVMLWNAAEPFNGSLSMPFHIRSIRFLTAALAEGASLRCYLRIKDTTPKSHVANIQVTDGHGRMLVDITGWEDLQCRMPQPLHRLIMRPRDSYLSQALPKSLFGNVAASVVGGIVADIPPPLFEINQEIWLQALAFTILNAAEREEWFSMTGAPGRRVEWLLGRGVAKDCVRRYLLDCHQQLWASSDIPIWADDSGKPHPHGAWQDKTPLFIDLSIAHTPGLIAAAIVANARIGIDVERIGRELSEDLTRGVFTPEEHELAARSGEGPIAILRFWCAKEALSKALGTGIRYSPSDLRVCELDAATGTLSMTVTGQWLNAFRQLRGHTIPVKTTLFQEHVFASCVLPLGISGGVV
ncbi:MAG: 4'-phosphopantetheinyl transferase superfamily protein [Lentisphaerae bacterium]|nr:4'-phosphopantetheinyl transferase superfamily protein [Lentisphaerota bacterium]